MSSSSKPTRESIKSLLARSKLQSFVTIMEVTSYDLCHILLVRSMLLSQPMLKGKGMNTRNQRLRDIFFLPQGPVTIYLSKGTMEKGEYPDVLKTVI